MCGSVRGRDWYECGTVPLVSDAERIMKEYE